MNPIVLQEYLVKLGWKVDSAEMLRFMRALNRASKDVEDHTNGLQRMFIKTAGVVAGVYAAIGVASVGLAERVSRADLGFQLFALKMFMSTEAAKKLKIATDALGYSLEEIAWNPELRQRYGQLIQDQTKMQQNLGQDYPRMIRAIRDVRFEFTRLSVAAQYIEMGVVANISRAFGLGEGGLQQKLHKFIDYIESPEGFTKVTTWISDKIVPVLKSIQTLGEDAATSFVHFVGTLSGDEKLKNAPLSLEAIGLAADHVATGVDKAVKNLDSLIKMFDKLPDWAKRGLAEGGVGFLLGGAPGAVIGATHGIVSTQLSKDYDKLTPEQKAAFEAQDQKKIDRLKSWFHIGSSAVRNLGWSKGEVERKIIQSAGGNDELAKYALAVAQVESRFATNRISRRGAYGVMQLMPETARSLGVDRYDTSQNIEGGVRMLLENYQKLGSWDKAIASYNTTWDRAKSGNLLPETQDYLRNVNEAAKKLDVGGITININNPNLTPDQLSAAIEHALHSEIAKKQQAQNKRNLAQMPAVY